MKMVTEGKLQKLIMGQRGMTLVEIVLAVAILGIITASFFEVFTGSYKTVFAAGDKNKAMTEASAKLERLYTLKNITQAVESVAPADQTIIPDLLGADKVATPGELETYSNVTAKYYVQKVYTGTDCDGYIFTISVFYSNGTKNVKLTSYVKGGT